MNITKPLLKAQKHFTKSKDPPTLFKAETDKSMS